MTLVLQVVAPHFSAPVSLRAGIVVDAPAYLRFARRWDTDRLLAYCSRRRWQVEHVSGELDAPVYVPPDDEAAA